MNSNVPHPCANGQRLEAQVLRLTREVAQLRERLDLNSRKSSQPTDARRGFQIGSQAQYVMYR